MNIMYNCIKNYFKIFLSTLYFIKFFIKIIVFGVYYKFLNRLIKEFSAKLAKSGQLFQEGPFSGKSSTFRQSL